MKNYLSTHLLVVMGIDWWRLAVTYIWTSRDAESLASRANSRSSLVRRVEYNRLRPPAPLASMQCAIAPTSHYPEGSIELRSLSGLLQMYVSSMANSCNTPKQSISFTHLGKIFVSIYYWRHKPRDMTQLSIASAGTILRSALWQGHPRRVL